MGWQDEHLRHLAEKMGVVLKACGVIKKDGRGKMEALIRMHTYEPCILTTQEYEQLQNEVIARSIADPGSVGDRILARLLVEHCGRYYEARTQNERR